MTLAMIIFFLVTDRSVKTIPRDHKIPLFIVSICANCRQIADTGLDYVSVSGSVVFEQGVTSKSFNLSLLEDTIPETDEYVFLLITDVQLNQSSLDVVDPGALQQLPPATIVSHSLL